MKRYLVFPLSVMAIAWGASFVLRGPAYLAMVAILTAVEVTFSFDNAAVDAKFLKQMSPGWQRVFLTIGPIIGVGLVRMVFPIALVAVTAALGFGEVWREAWHDQSLYQLNLQQARPEVVALAAPFLALTFLTWAMHPDKELHWPVMAKAERWLKRLGGGRPRLGVLLVLAVMIIIFATTDPHATWLVFGLVSVAAFVGVNWLNGRTEKYLAEGKGLALAKKATFAVGLSQLARLELVDASFSLDSVSGAFAITSDFTAILVGLGVGALFVRAFTKMAVDHGTLDKYMYIEHGAHWSIGALAVLLPLSVVVEIPAIVTGAVSVGLIGVAVVSSVLEIRRVASA